MSDSEVTKAADTTVGRNPSVMHADLNVRLNNIKTIDFDYLRGTIQTS